MDGRTPQCVPATGARPGEHHLAGRPRGLRANRKSGGRRPRKARRRSSSSRRPGFRATASSRASATWISMSSPSFSSSASTTAAGRRTAKLFPHLETCMVCSHGYTEAPMCIHKRRPSRRARPRRAAEGPPGNPCGTRGARRPCFRLTRGAEPHAKETCLRPTAHARPSRCAAPGRGSRRSRAAPDGEEALLIETATADLRHLIDRSDRRALVLIVGRGQARPGRGDGVRPPRAVLDNAAGATPPARLAARCRLRAVRRGARRREGPARSPRGHPRSAGRRSADGRSTGRRRAVARLGKEPERRELAAPAGAWAPDPPARRHHSVPGSARGSSASGQNVRM